MTNIYKHTLLLYYILYANRAEVVEREEHQRGGQHNIDGQYCIGASLAQIHITIANRGGSLHSEVQALDERPVLHSAEYSSGNEQKNDDKHQSAK